MKKAAALVFVALITFGRGCYSNTTSHEAHADTKSSLDYIDPMRPVLSI